MYNQKSDKVVSLLSSALLSKKQGNDSIFTRSALKLYQIRKTIKYKLFEFKEGNESQNEFPSSQFK